MESEKQGVSSETTSSSEENDQQSEGQVVNRSDESSSGKRSYECTYCKRGFTNAQALGGHMNIHRKDRAKAKQQPSSVSNNRYEAEIAMAAASPFSTPFSSQPAAPWTYQPPSVVEACQRNYNNMYFHHHHQPSAYDGTNYGNDYYNQFGSRSSMSSSTQSLTMNEELLGANLSLRMSSSSHLDDSEARRGSLMRINSSDEIDLELRLGHGHE